MAAHGVGRRDPGTELVEEFVSEIGSLIADTWKVLLPLAVLAVGWWGWTHEAWIGAEGWDRVRSGLWVLAGLVVVGMGLRVWWVWRTLPHRKAKVRARDAVDAAKVPGTAVVTDRQGRAGYVQLDPDSHLTATQRTRLTGALSEKLGVPVELGATDSKDRVPFRPARVEAERDVLAATIPAVPYPSKVDLSGLHVGTRADGKPFLLNLAEGRHTLVVGATGSGKGSVIQSILRQLAPAIKAGLVRVIFIDPKGGAEGLPVRGVCHTVMVGTGKNMEEVAEFMDGLSNEVVRDAMRLASQGKRAHVATREHPFTVVIVDECASITEYMGTPQTQRTCEQALGALTTMGRSAGWAVVGLVQDPRKKVLSIRGLFPQRVALRLSEVHEVDWVLGSAARERGAECHLIPKGRQGTGFLTVDGDPDPLKIRFAFPTDSDLVDMVERFPAPVAPRVLGLPEGFFG